MAYDAIVIPGGGVRAGGVLPGWVTSRLDRALELENGEPIITLSAGTMHLPLPVNAYGLPLWECAAGAAYLVERGFPAERILMEASSWDTIGNAYFCRVQHCEPRSLRRLLVINSQFHMPRTEAIFRFVFGLAPGDYELSFEAVADRGMEPQALVARQRKERHALEEFQHNVASRISSLQQFHSWMFTEHDAYSARGLRQERIPLAEEALRSY